jgi:hypothetical protein
MNVVQKLRQLHADITTSGNGLKIVDGWALAERLTGRFPIDPTERQRVFREKDAQGLLRMIDEIEKPQPAAADEPEYDSEHLAAAMRAFKGRWKTTRLADESRLGGRYVSSGKSSGISGIEPPPGFEPGVWKHLVKVGRLTDERHGLYALPPGQPRDGERV